MDTRLYSKEVVTNIIHFMSMAHAGIKPDQELMDSIPEEFHAIIAASVLAAKEVEKVRKVMQQITQGAEMFGDASNN